MPHALSVPFHGTQLFIVSHNGEAHVPMYPIIEGMGLSRAAQLRKLKRQFASWVLPLLVRFPENPQRQNVICLPLRKLSGWLQTINPGKVSPEAGKTVALYQNECDDTLYQHWTAHQAGQKKPAIPERTHLRAGSRLLTTLMPNGKNSVEVLSDDVLIGHANTILELLRDRGWLVIPHEQLSKKLLAFLKTL